MLSSGPDIRSLHVERFRAAIAGCLGLSFDDAKQGFLDEVLRRRLQATDLHPDVYIARLEREKPSEEVSALARDLTVGETYFFRNVDQFRAFSEVVLPAHLASQTADRRLRILSAGCASGEEAYSLAILVRAAVADPSWSVSIVGVDVNTGMIDRARRGRFSAWALRETPQDVKQRWFRAEGKDFVIDESLRPLVRFEERNLAEANATLWQPASYDVVFCRNVIMYFTQEMAQALIGRITVALRPGGHLVLGHAETLRGLSTDFHLQHTHETFYYRRKDRHEHVSRAPAPVVQVPQVTLLEAAVDSTDTWVEAIRRATDRIAALTASSGTRSPARADVAAVAARPVWDLGFALELLRKERFAEALEMLEALPPASGRDVDVLLLHAVLLTHANQLQKAEAMCQRLLEIDELSAGAHYLLALCREGIGDRQDALRHDQIAAYLDPDFAMPRLHMGLLARRAGDREGARKELQRALALLQREDAFKVLLFGGGFGREALVGVCRSELLACGGTS